MARAGLAAILAVLLVALAGAPAAALPVGAPSSALAQRWLWQIAAGSPALDQAQKARALAAAGNLKEAIDVERQALDLAQREFGQDHAYVAFILDDLATLHLRLNQLDDALDYGRRAVATIERAKPGSVESATLAGNLATIYGARGEYVKAEPLYKNAYEIFLAQLGADRAETAATARNLGIAYAELSRREEALGYFERAAAARKQLDGAASIAYASALLDLAGGQLALERAADARTTVGQARAILEQQGAGPVPLAEAGITLARAAILESKLDEAESLLKDARKRLGADGQASQALTASVLYNLGFVDFLRGQFVEAEPVYRQALELYQGAVGPRHPAVARTLHSLALIYHGLGQYDEAEQLYRRALEIFTADFGAGDPSGAATRVELAAMLTERGEPQRAEPEARAALAAYERAPGDWDLRRGYGFSSLGYALRKQGRTDEAAADFERAIALITKVRGAQSSDLPPGLIELGEIYTAKGRYADADAALARAIAIRERDGALTPWGLAKALSALAQLRLAQGRGEEALSAAQRATTIVRDRLDAAEQSLSAAAQGEVVSARHIIERQLEIGDAMRSRSGGDRASGADVRCRTAAASDLGRRLARRGDGQAAPRPAGAGRAGRQAPERAGAVARARPAAARPDGRRYAWQGR